MMMKDLSQYPAKDIQCMCYKYNVDTDDILQSIYELSYINLNRREADMLVEFQQDTLEIPDDILDIRNYTINRKIGQGTYGVVYIVTDKNKNEYVYKIQKISNENELNSFISENKINELLNNKVDVGPKVIKYYVSDYKILDTSTNKNIKIGITILDKWDGDVSKIPLNNINVDYLLKQIKLMHSVGIIHNDLKLENVLYKKENGTYKFTISDFGLARNINNLNMNEIKMLYEWMKQHYYDDIGVTNRKNKRQVAYANYIKQETFNYFTWDKIKTDPFNIDNIFIYILYRHVNPSYSKDEVLNKINTYSKFIQSIDIHTAKPFKMDTRQAIINIDTVCINPQIDISKLELIGQGWYSNVYSYVIDNKKYAIKIQLLTDTQSIQNFMKEINIQSELNTYNIGPQLNGWEICDTKQTAYYKYTKESKQVDVGYVSLDKWDGNLFEYFNRYNFINKTNDIYSIKPVSQLKDITQIQQQIATLICQIKKIHELGYVHLDLKIYNCLYKLENGNIQTTISDFGVMEKKEDILKTDYNKPDSLISKAREYYYNALCSEFQLFDYKYRQEAFELYPFDKNKLENNDLVFAYIIGRQFNIFKSQEEGYSLLKSNLQDFEFCRKVI